MRRALLLAVAALAAACDSPEDPIPDSVPASWRAVRLAPGHTAHLEAGTKCNSCHPKSFDPLDVLPCDGCHHESRAPLHLGSREASPNCINCHRFGADEAVEPWGCNNCHTTETIETHTTERCESCHVAHGPKQKTNCASCHEEVKRDTPKHECATCHVGHQPKERVEFRCLSCHEDQKKKLEAHDKCSDCHVPHEPQPKSCASCHDQVPSPKHEKCYDCHDQHQTRSTSCAGCHDDTKVVHRVFGDRETPFAALEMPNAESCSTCHVMHTKVAPPPKSKDCSSCHTAAKRDELAHAGKADCDDCHQPHDFSSAPKECVSCHQVATLQDHRDCNSCHVNASHQPSTPKIACATCHEAVQAPPGHRDCAKCHEPHGGAMKAGVDCASCHQPEASSKHARVEGGCNTCHQPHTLEAQPTAQVKRAADCSSCHARGSLVGLHLNGGHQKCASCHESHELEPPRTRADCVTCHSAQVQHEPKAQICSSCHPFAAGNKKPTVSLDRYPSVARPAIGAPDPARHAP